MDVRCERCQTEYELDDARIGDAGVAVKCTTCGQVFKVQRAPAAAGPIPLEKPRGWKVRRPDGQVYALENLPELQRWIVERRVVRDDEVSLSGEAWRKLGSMPELASFFEVVEQAARAQAAEARAAVTATAPSPVSPPPAAAPQRSASWETTPQSLAPAAGHQEPAWTASPGVSAVDDDLDAEALRQVRGSRAPLVIVILLLLAAVGAGVYFFALRPAPPPPPAPKAAAPTPPVAPPPAPAPPAATAPTGVVSPPVAAPQPGAKPTPAPTTPPPAKAEAKPKESPAGAAAQPAAPKGEPKPAAEAGHDFNWYMGRGHKLLDNKPKQALDMFEQAAQKNPDSPEPDSGRGIAYSNLEQWGKAIAAFQSALKKSPNYNEAVMGLAEAYRYSGDKKHAMLYYRKYLDIAPDGPDAPAAKAQIDSLKGD